MNKVISSKDKSFIIFAHRGAHNEPGAGPIENTMEAFLAAQKLGVAIEYDVRECKSDPLVVFHDGDLNRIIKKSGLVKDYSLKNLQAFRFGKDQYIPTLNEVLSTCNKIRHNIELKEPKLSIRLLEEINRCITDIEVRNKVVLVSSFLHKDLQELRKKDKTIPIGVLYKELPKNFDVPVGLSAFSIHIAIESVPKDLKQAQCFVQEAHDKKLKVFVYTVNDPDGALSLMKIGVDGIFSDVPEKILKVIDSSGLSLDL